MVSTGVRLTRRAATSSRSSEGIRRRNDRSQATKKPAIAAIPRPPLMSTVGAKAPWLGAAMIAKVIPANPPSSAPPRVRRPIRWRWGHVSRARVGAQPRDGTGRGQTAGTYL